MKPVKTFTVTSQIPQRLKRLRELAYNLRWTWDKESIDLFRRMDRDLWEQLNHNPVKILGAIRQEVLEDLLKDEGFLAHYDRVLKGFDRFLSRQTWYQKKYGKRDKPSIAYFSAEFGLTESLPIYSGGLGILAGDHLKSASALGLPLVGVGLCYQMGYFRQYLNNDGWQGEHYPVNDFFNMPLEPVNNNDGTPLMVGIDFPGRKVMARIWRVNVGRISLYLLDTNVPDNNKDDQEITSGLYGGDIETRIRQEIVLGIGGMRALKALGIQPDVFHMNEGHSAFLSVERVSQMMEEKGLSFREAKEACKAGTVFTTHTPVPAGIDIFPVALVEKYLRDYIQSINIPWEEFLSSGMEGDSSFSMAVLALEMSCQANGVSRLHGQVSRKMWQHIWPNIPEDEVPIQHVTNGIHHRSWVSHDMESLLERYLGKDWLMHPEDQTVWNRVAQIPPEELWRTHERRRERFVAFARKRYRDQLIRRGAPAAEISMADSILDPEILTIGFARRFATYKRADLLFRNPERLSTILNNEKMPVQIIFSGKAHPKDGPGKELIKELVHFSRKEEFRRRILFIEDYDMVVSRYMVQGVDVWLNTPRRLYEASGTSGMKGLVNGVLNMSILDGWWDEAYRPGIGWAIGKGEEYEDLDYQYDIESDAIYDLLEKEIVPLFYDRASDRLPRRWVRYMKDSMQSLCPVFNTHRMVCEYTDKFYMKAEKHYGLLAENNMEKAKELSRWKETISDNWHKIRIDKIEVDNESDIHVGSKTNIKVNVFLGSISPEDVTVEVYHGEVDQNERIINCNHVPLSVAGPSGNEASVYGGAFECSRSGRYGFSVRVFPKNSSLLNPLDTGLILWAA